MEGSSHSQRTNEAEAQQRPLPTGPRPDPPRPQPRRRANQNKRAKVGNTAQPPETQVQTQPNSITTAQPNTIHPIPYQIVAMMLPTERFPDDVKSIPVTISIPSPDEECPIALEPICSAALTFLPNCSFIKDFPEYAKMTLPCGHSFAAMILIYNWCKNSMLCPCCRQGLDRRANIRLLPAHFKYEMAVHIRSTTRAERLESEREHAEDILRMSPATFSFRELAENGNLDLTIGFLSRQSDQNTHELRRYFSITAHLTPRMVQRRNVSVTAFSPLEHHMNIIRNAELCSIIITTNMRIRNAGTIDIDSSGVIAAPAPIPNSTGSDLTHLPLIHRSVTGYYTPNDPTITPNNRIPHIPISTFEITFGQRNGQIFLSGLTWIPDSSHVHVSVHRLEPATGST